LDFQRAFQAVDVIVMPGVPYLVPRQDQLVADFGNRQLPLADVVSRNTAIMNLIGAPSTTVPCALDDRGLPIGVQVVARPLAETMCLRLADALEQLCAFADLVPPVLRSLDTLRSAISTVYQGLAVVDTLDVGRNIYLGMVPRRFGVFVDYPKMYADSQVVLDRLRISLKSVRTRVGDLSGGQRQSVAIARAL